MPRWTKHSCKKHIKPYSRSQILWKVELYIYLNPECHTVLFLKSQLTKAVKTDASVGRLRSDATERWFLVCGAIVCHVQISLCLHARRVQEAVFCKKLAVRINLSTSDDLYQPQRNRGFEVVVQIELISEVASVYLLYFLSSVFTPASVLNLFVTLCKRTTSSSFWMLLTGLSTSIPGNNLRTQGNM